MNETKYAYAISEPHSSSPFLASGSHGLPFKQANIMSGHASPVAHLKGQIEKWVDYYLRIFTFKKKTKKKKIFKIK